MGEPPTVERLRHKGVACCANALVPSYLVEMNTNTSTGSPVVVSPAGTTSPWSEYLWL